MNDATKDKLREALGRYERRTGRAFEAPAQAVLFDMDGILYDSMPLHARAWMAMCREKGISATEEEFFGYEGRTGASTIDILIRRQYGRPATEEEKQELYAIKSRAFAAMTAPPLMDGARECAGLAHERAVAVLVTGSGQRSVLDRLDRDFPGVFGEGRRVTAFDVTHGKPHPEPFLRGMEKAGSEPWRSIAVDNAPLGVEAGAASGALTIGVRTGPLPAGALLAAGADIEINSMGECTILLSRLL